MPDSNLGLSDYRILCATMPGNQCSLAFGCNPLGECDSTCQRHVWFISKINKNHGCLTDRKRKKGESKREKKTRRASKSVKFSGALFFLIIKVITWDRNKLFKGPDRV